MAFVKAALVVALVVGVVAPTSASGPRSGEPFASLHARVKPAPSEQRWEEVPWLTSLWEARKRAAAEGKPILLWEMDGHPLGGT